MMLVIGVSACTPQLPKDVNEAQLESAVAAAVGDEHTCVILNDVSGKAVWRAGLGHACRVQYSACIQDKLITDEEFAKAAAAPGAMPVRTGCQSVSWASGKTPKRGMTYGAVMWGSRALPGIEIGRRLDDVFANAGL